MQNFLPSAHTNVNKKIKVFLPQTKITLEVNQQNNEKHRRKILNAKERI